jgi:hypothetical protein
MSNDRDEIDRLDDRLAKRREKVRQQDEEMQRAIRETEERRKDEKPAE